MKNVIVAVLVIAIVGVSAFSMYSLSNSANPTSTRNSVVSTTTSTSSSSLPGPGLTFNSTTQLPVGCDVPAQVSSNGGYSLTIYVNATSVKLGNTMCTVAFLKNVNSSIVLTQATAYKANFNFSVIDSSGKTVLVVFCTSDPPPPSSVAGANFTKPVVNFICSNLWDTRAAYVSSPNTTPQPGTYQIVASASFPTLDEATGQNSTGHIAMSTDVQVQAAASG